MEMIRRLAAEPALLPAFNCWDIQLDDRQTHDYPMIVTFLSSGHVCFLLMSAVEALDGAIHAIATPMYTAASNR
eukprot:1163012-Rhodomonas_salina.1